jgi:hypothetical protein
LLYPLFPLVCSPACIPRSPRAPLCRSASGLAVPSCMPWPRGPRVRTPLRACRSHRRSSLTTAPRLLALPLLRACALCRVDRRRRAQSPRGTADCRRPIGRRRPAPLLPVPRRRGGACAKLHGVTETAACAFHRPSQRRWRLPWPSTRCHVRQLTSLPPAPRRQVMFCIISASWATSSRPRPRRRCSPDVPDICVPDISDCHEGATASEPSPVCSVASLPCSPRPTEQCLLTSVLPPWRSRRRRYRSWRLWRASSRVRAKKALRWRPGCSTSLSTRWQAGLVYGRGRFLCGPCSSASGSGLELSAPESQMQLPHSRSGLDCASESRREGRSR